MGVKVYATNGKVVGEVQGKTLRKVFHGSRHMLQKPRAIANDIAVLEDAEKAGAVEVEERDVETGAVYCATIATIRAHGFHLDRGYGPQIALTLNRWTVSGGAPNVGSGTSGSSVGPAGPAGPEMRQTAFDLGPAGRVRL